MKSRLVYVSPLVEQVIYLELVNLLYSFSANAQPWKEDEELVPEDNPYI